MMLESVDKSFITKRVVTIATVATFGGVSLLFGGIHYLLRNAAAAALAASSGDTPVVLVGGSMVFKSNFNRTAQDWAPVGSDGKEYKVTAAYQITAIAIKASAPKNDGDGATPGDALTSTDKLSIDVTNAVPWQIDEFTAASPTTSVTSVFSVQNAGNTEIHIRLNDPKGAFCPVNGKYRRIAYSPTSSCPASGLPDPVSFSQISITVNGDTNPDGTPKPSGTLNCLDSSGDGQGYCRIALRGTP